MKTGEQPAPGKWAPQIELLYFADCPHYQQALAMVCDVLASAGITASVDLVAVETPAEAERQHFYGSPTIRVDGVDIVPPDPTTRPALACRVYRTAQGALTPIPPAEVFAAAFQRD
jgi:hypothetical protein